MKKRRLTPKLLDQLSELRNTRESIDRYYLNFLVNAAKYANFVHYVLEFKPDNETLQIPIIQYISSLVSCWETFFRDVFIFMTSIDTAFMNDICNKLNIDSSTYKNLIDDDTFSEFLSKSFNFQSIDEIESAFEFIFNKHMFSIIGSYEIPNLFIRGRFKKDFCINKLFPEWEADIFKAFDERHKITHDANYIKCINIDKRFIQSVETIFVIFPQVLSIWLASKYNLSYTTMLMNTEQLTISKDNDNSNSYPYLFIIDDLISKEWIICD